MLHRIKSKRDERLLHDSAKTREKPAVLAIVRLRSAAIAAVISFIAAAAPATTAKSVQSFIVSLCIKWHCWLVGWLGLACILIIYIKNINLQNEIPTSSK